MKKTMKTMLRFTLILLSLCCLLSGCIMPASAQSENVRLICLNIGKADCMLLLSGDDAWLIDAGYAHTYPALEAMLRQYKITHLNGVILTHCHEDHEGGLLALAASGITVDAWYAASIFYDVKLKKHPAVLAAAAQGASVTWLDAGMCLPVGDDASLTVLAPMQINRDNENNNSLVLRFSSPHGSILLAGDMKEEEEADLLLSGALLKSDVLKVGHHGDNNATGASLLRAVNPQIALILTSTFEEADTPSTATLSRLKKIGAAVYVSQNMQDAMEVTLQSGALSVRDIAWDFAPRPLPSLSMTLDFANDLIVLTNQGTDSLSLSGLVLYSSRGNDAFPLPDQLLPPQSSYTIGSRATGVPCDLRLDEKRIWHEKKRDMAILYDAYARVLACTDNGLPD